jgi:nitroimidazol reductase NimA-like FMN-containing flavoprotein (pyridoxamine 5'-phosphate oxidase superfamily)
MLQGTKKDMSDIRAMLSAQTRGVLATYGGEYPHCSLLAVTATDDLKILLFATARETRKYQHILHYPKVALLIDEHVKRDKGESEACALTARGEAHEVQQRDRERYEKIFLSKHPALARFLHQEGTALIALRVHAYTLVRTFQDITEIVME